MVEQKVSLYRRDGVYLFCPSTRTTAGAGSYLNHGPGFALSNDAPPKILGHCVLMAMSLSEGVVPHPKDWSAVKSCLLAFTGAKGWRGFHSADITLVDVQRTDTEVLIELMPEAEDFKGFQKAKWFPGIRLPLSVSDEELGLALLQAFTAYDNHQRT